MKNIFAVFIVLSVLIYTGMKFLGLEELTFLLTYPLAALFLIISIVFHFKERKGDVALNSAKTATDKMFITGVLIIVFTGLVLAFFAFYANSFTW